MRALVLGPLLGIFSPLPAAHWSPPDPVTRAGQEPVDELRRELAHLSEWFLQVEGRDVSDGHFPGAKARLDAVLSALELDAPEGDEERAVVALIEEVLREYNADALPLLALVGEDGEVVATWDRLRELRAALGEYHGNTGRYPTIGEGLATLLVAGSAGGARVEPGQLLDAWGREFHYGKWDETSYELRSAGPDGVVDNQDDLVGDERGLHRDDPTRTLGSRVVATAIKEIAVDRSTVRVRLENVTRHRHWDIELDRKEEVPMPVGEEVKLSVDGLRETLLLTTEAEGWVRFDVDPELLEERIRRGEGSMIFSFDVLASRGPVPGVRLGLDWSLGVIGKAMEGTSMERLVRWEELLAAVPDSEAGAAVRQGIESYLGPLREQTRLEHERILEALSHERIQRIAEIDSAGGLDPPTLAARAECMRLQVQLAETCLAAGDTRGASRAFGNAARHASDNDDLDALEALIERQLRSRETVR